MTFVAGAIVWAGYVLVWWGWEAVTDHVPPGPADTIHWPSIRDLITPGRTAFAVPPRISAPGQIMAGGTAISPLAGPSGTIVAQDPNAPVFSQPVPQNDTYLNPILHA